MQDSNIFTVGGSLSVNVHGKDPRYGSLIESVNYLKMVTADGKEILCDKTHNKDLFSAVIGILRYSQVETSPTQPAQNKPQATSGRSKGRAELEKVNVKEGLFRE